MIDRYGSDVLAVSHTQARRPPMQVAADIGMVLECPHTGWCGAIVGLQKGPG